ncbi:hypothetical protein BGZ57DRAFT_936628 [Hyaloscypha finlandica]|nr:hypothetical protein BGZ57DRAFT_936628 [Hyaloscypha finlandica]
MAKEPHGEIGGIARYTSYKSTIDYYRQPDPVTYSRLLTETTKKAIELASQNRTPSRNTPGNVTDVTDTERELTTGRTMSTFQTTIVPIPANRTYFFEGYYVGAQDAVLDHANFISVVNDSDVAKTIFPETKLGEDVNEIREVADDPDDGNTETLSWKQRQYNFGIDKPEDVPEIVHENRVHICNIDPNIATALYDLVSRYQEYWSDRGPIRIP